jgi:hypothetical protein
VFINNSAAVLQSLKDNADQYKNPSPPLATVQTSLDNLTAAQIALPADQAATALRNKCLQIHLANMRLLALYVQANCNNDLNTFLLSGFPVQKTTRTPVGVPATPQNLILTQGPRSGELLLKVNPVFGASLYNWTLTPATAGAAVLTAQTTAASAVVDGLTPGECYTGTVNVVGTAGASGWSSPASLFVN